MAGACKNQPTVDLLLTFAAKPDGWLGIEKYTNTFCDISSQPIDDGKWEFRIHYAEPTGKKTLALHVYQTTRNFVADHWLEVAGKKTVARPVAKTASAKKGAKKTSKIVRDAKDGNTFLDENSWEAILGDSGTAFSFDSPELDRFRLGHAEINYGIPTDSIEKRPLRVPLFPLPMLDDGPDFSPKKMKLPTFTKADLEGKGLTERDVEGALLSVKLILKHFEDKEWLKAQQTVEIFEKSEFRKAVPVSKPEWWALKGQIYLELGNSQKKPDFISYGLGIWRDGLRTTAGKGGLSRDYIDFMALETSRLLYESHQYYALAAFVVWSQRYRWKVETEERLGFMLAESHYQLALYDEARTLFSEFLDTRKNLPLSAAEDRRLVPYAAFRLGDCDLRLSLFKEAVASYTKSLANVPSLERASFEQSWYPGEVVHYPSVFLHRAEASLRLGAEKNALKDLRAFVNFGGTHPQLGLVLFRLGELLHLLDPKSDKAQVAWRECQFRVGNSLGGRLCTARARASDISEKAKDDWPRVIAGVEDAQPTEHDPKFRGAWKNEITGYLEILLADSFIRINQPFQALERLNKIRNLEVSDFMSAWRREYTIVALSGWMRDQIAAGKAREVPKIYDSYKNRLLIKQNRHEVLWYLAQAYTHLRLWKEAWETLKTAEGLRDKLGRAELRPFEEGPAAWATAFVEVGAEEIDRKEVATAEVAPYVKLLPKDDLRALRAAIRFYQVSKDHAGELASYRVLLDRLPGTWSEISRYLDLLKETGKDAEYAKVIENSVGVWLGDDSNLRSKDQPGAELFLKLFEVRKKTDRDRAMVPLEYLLHSDIAKKEVGFPMEMVVFKKAETLLAWGRKDEAKKQFSDVISMAPDSMWAERAGTELKSLEIDQEKNLR